MNREKDSIPRLGQKEQALDRALLQAGKSWRSKRARPGEGEVSPASRLRMTEALIETARKERARSWFGLFAGYPALGFAGWLRGISRPLGYGLAGAFAALALFVWLAPSQQPPVHVLYSADSKDVRASGSAKIVARQEPGTVIEFGTDSQVLVRSGACVEAASASRLRLSSGEIWLYHAGTPRDIQIETPLGTVIPTGTVFGVRLAEAGASPAANKASIEVAVMEGKVEISMAGGGSASQVAAGQRFSAASDGTAPRIETDSVEVPEWAQELLAAWRQSFFERYFPSAAGAPARNKSD